MLLSVELAERYAQYRERFLSGSLGLYCGFPGNISDPCGSGVDRQYKSGQPAPFIVLSNRPLNEIGTLIHCDVMEFTDEDCAGVPNSGFAVPEEASIKKLKFGDNLVYSSVAMVNFAAEYAISGLSQSLELATNILRSYASVTSLL